ncbi:MAG: hypothetical protein JXA54_15470 [Candidatus Heimdallarchaeota archaeon]|nr:hypothetical protein [Candidatus Heimdallarchaeota archaeon]
MSISTFINMHVGRSESYYILEGDMENLQVEDLIAGNIYDIDLRVGSFEDPYDLGLSIYDEGKYKTLLLTIDSVGTAPEIGQFTPTRNGTFYLLVYNNDDEGVFIEITITDSLSSEEMDIGYYYPTYDPSGLLWVWILVGVIGGITVLAMILLPVFIILKSKKEIDKIAGVTLGTNVEDAKIAPYSTKIVKSGKKRICPYCKVKIPDNETLIQCPYCSAPLTNEE